jgi:hypothetical protein
MRTLSLRARQAINAPETAEVFLALVVIEHPTLPEPLRFANNMEDVYSTVHGEATAQQYFGCPFNLALPSERDDQLPNVTLTIDNVDQNIVAALRQLADGPTMTLYIVLAATPDVREAGPFPFRLMAAHYTAETVSGTLAFLDILNEPHPWRTFTPPDFPGVFA